MILPLQMEHSPSHTRRSRRQTSLRQNPLHPPLLGQIHSIHHLHLALPMSRVKHQHLPLFIRPFPALTPNLTFLPPPHQYRHLRWLPCRPPARPSPFDVHNHKCSREATFCLGPCPWTHNCQQQHPNRDNRQTAPAHLQEEGSVTQITRPVVSTDGQIRTSWFEGPTRLTQNGRTVQSFALAQAGHGGADSVGLGCAIAQRTLILKTLNIVYLYFHPFSCCFN